MWKISSIEIETLRVREAEGWNKSQGNGFEWVNNVGKLDNITNLLLHTKLRARAVGALNGV